MQVLLVIDMQNDFIDGSLGTKEAQAIVDKVVDKIQNFDGKIFFTRDTHSDNYLSTREGKMLPVKHCIYGTNGWQIHPKLHVSEKEEVIDKPTFGSVKLAQMLVKLHEQEALESITLVGLCTDICVISNALLIKAFLPEVPIVVDASCCAGVTPDSHQRALETMQTCQIEIENI